MLDFRHYEVLTFDCYGTLIDWESGIFSALRPILAAHGKSLGDVETLALYGEIEAEVEASEYHTYREVLRRVVELFGERLGFVPTLQESDSLADSVPLWKPWPDSVEALKTLQSRYRLVIVSNIDDALFAGTAPKLQVAFQHVITAEQAHCYKPGVGIFQLALRRIGIPASRILHVGQSIYHDVLPAKGLGMGTVWVNRPSPRVNIGAVKPALGDPDLTVPDLATLAKLLVEG